ncbi:hypothetical protein Ga0074812_11618 [Parafrankia irregularis]|uniref:Uncharacterized protein n=1 Tax=Parafrankia irregularis TaxID=795642 RepID=A0A0S4QU76_9ACTN|nr:MULTISPECIES: DUF5947 family protein [Parafrankia]MBE3199837.1 hypothetical protein [Parafrankia sp. CH37]CUU57990.1 hypothetical protein Ga0074812_11618 [Parafrankia irregularis]
MTARTLRRFLAGNLGRAMTRCEFCGEAVTDEHGHGHVADLASRSILCACPGCRLLFTPTGAGGGRYRAIPTRYHFAPSFAAGPRLLAAAGIPVGLAFFVIHDGTVNAFYPSPAGATHCELPATLTPQDLNLDDPGGPGTGTDRATGGPVWRPEPEVEAVLVHVTRDGQAGYLLPIDACYRLVGDLRLHWRGFDGGADARAHLAAFLADARHRAGAAPAAAASAADAASAAAAPMTSAVGGARWPT